MSGNKKSQPASSRISNLFVMLNPIIGFLTDSFYTRLVNEPGICDFTLGNPQEMPLPDFVEALKKALVPQNKDWYAYKDSETISRETAAASLSRLHGLSYHPDDISMTNGAFAALAASLFTLIDPGDEVVFLSPPWFFYESLISSVGGIPVRVKLSPPNFDLDLDAVSSALTKRTRALILNSPNNPTGRIYPPAALQGLANLLKEQSQLNGRPIYILSDEAYNRIVYDDCKFHTPAAFYPNTLVQYTYGKTLLTPGQRLGYIAIPPEMPDRKALGAALFISQVMKGYAFPNALLQHALPELENLSIDIGHLQRKRDRMAAELSRFGYEVNKPQATFYMLVRSPLEDDLAFAEQLSEQGVLCLPGRFFELPGYFRISLTANDEMIERALPAFKDTLEAVSK